METFGNLLLVLVMLLNFSLVGTSRLNIVIRTAALQGVILGVMPLIVSQHLTVEVGVIAMVTVLLKGSVIPSLLFRAMREVNIGREIKPLLGFMASMLILVIGTALCIALAAYLPLASTHRESLIVPASFATIFTGFILLTTRQKAITQVIGFLTLENGVFAFALLLIEVMPFLVEIGILLDLFVAIFAMGIIINHIQRTFSSLDTLSLSSLKE